MRVSHIVHNCPKSGPTFSRPYLIDYDQTPAWSTKVVRISDPDRHATQGMHRAWSLPKVGISLCSRTPNEVQGDPEDVVPP